MTAYYNEKDPNAAVWLRELIAQGYVAAGEVDERSIVDVRSTDLAGFTQCHFFAGIGGWSLALRYAGWGDDIPVWTGSCPCQPFSAAGQRKGFDDERHLWPEFKRLIAEQHPPIVFGEQVASATDWLRLVRSDLETLDYAVGAMPIQAASAGADHLRDRYWFVGHAQHARLEGCNRPSDLAVSRATESIRSVRPAGLSLCPAGKSRRVKPGVRLLADGFPTRVGLLRGFGNAIDPRPAAQFIGAVRESLGA